MSSDMPDRYINRTGVVELEAIESIRGDELSKVERDNKELTLTLTRLEGQYNELQEKLAKRIDMDTFLSELLQDNELGKIIASRIKNKQLGDKLMRL